MNITFTFKNFEPSEHLRQYARRRMDKLGRFFGKNAALDAQVVMLVDKFRQRIEVQLSGDGINISAEEQSQDMYASIDLVTDKLSAQIKKFISKNRDQWRTAHSVPDHIDVFSFTEPEPKDPSIVDRGDVHYTPKPMSPEEAALQLDAKGDEFLVFRNGQNQRINVIYHRKNGDYGLIDPAV